MADWIRAVTKSFGFAFAGIFWALGRERNLQIHAGATLGALVAGAMLKLETWEWCAILLCIGLVWMAELFNTALEILADAVTQEQNERIRRAKDVAAGAVLVAAIAAAGVGAVIFLPKLW